jgi:YNFM family putative membrane transporter
MANTKNRYLVLQTVVFSLVAAAFVNIYVTQPVQPALAEEFGVSVSSVALTVSAVILGIFLANLPFGLLADRLPIQPIILFGCLALALFGVLCALSQSLWLLVAGRFLQGLVIPALTTCLAAYLGRNLPVDKLNVAMGSYVSATVVGGLGSRLLGGFCGAEDWRLAFYLAGGLAVLAGLAALRWLPKDDLRQSSKTEADGFQKILSRPDLLRPYAATFTSMFVFSSLFNYMPFYLAGPPFEVGTATVTLMYFSYLMGVVIGPLAGKAAGRLGGGLSMASGAVVFALAVGISLMPSLPAMALSLTLVCAGHFTVHSVAAGALNSRLSQSQGRANSLYVLFYYLGAWCGITVSGWAYSWAGWLAVALLGLAVLSVPLCIGLWERRSAPSLDQA